MTACAQYRRRVPAGRCLPFDKPDGTAAIRTRSRQRAPPDRWRRASLVMGGLSGCRSRATEVAMPFTSGTASSSWQRDHQHV